MVKEIARTVEGKTIYFEVTITPLYYQLGQFAGHFLMFHDITERKLARLALERANEALEQRVIARTAELQQANLRLAEMAVTEERLRIAREMHDGLGHYLMGLSIQLQVATDRVPAEAEDLKILVDRCRHEVAAAIAESRRSVSALRKCSTLSKPLTDAIADLTQEFRSKLPCELRIHQRGYVADLPPQQSHAIYRTVQEALTNILKYAQDTTAVSITFDYDDERRLVRVENRSLAHWGEGEPETLLFLSAKCCAENGHYGLAGLSERAEQLGGHLDAGMLPNGGFYVEMTLPTERAPV
jgi:signal transduction histidine kinase